MKRKLKNEELENINGGGICGGGNHTLVSYEMCVEYWDNGHIVYHYMTMRLYEDTRLDEQGRTFKDVGKAWCEANGKEHFNTVYKGQEGKAPSFH